MVKANYITFRSDFSTLQQFRELLRFDVLQRAEEARLVFSLGIKNRRIQLALQKYRSKELTLEKAAEVADLSVYEMVELLQEKGIEYNLDKDSVKEYLQKAVK